MTESKNHPYQVVTIEGVECVTPKAASLYLDVHISTVYNRINSRFGYLESVDLDGRPMVKVASMEREKKRMAAEAEKAVTA